MLARTRVFGAVSFFLQPRLRAMSSSTPKPPSAPRPSASLVVINPRNEILFVHRNPEARSFGGVHVFPGGNFDAAQDSSLAETAIRETFEEAGLLFASGSGSNFPDNEAFDIARKSVHANNGWKEFLKKYELKPDTQALLPFTQWITPSFVPRRFQTQFFVTFLAGSSSAGFSSGTKEERIPTSDGGLEVLSARFLHPRTAIALFASNEITLMPPQYYIVKTLADLLASADGPSTLAERANIERLANGPFGRIVINPKLLKTPDIPKGTTVLTYEGDETRGGPPGRMHRAITKMNKAGVTTEITLLRNFDIFTEVAELGSKL
ncbi:Nudix hydrolase domain-containing protein [Mycena indigotica]|uniref:Nudix hydrolase domain-containing protein n=1 Tax=Mycena indigotica TaxID=2126181 RepID=A0A8H6S9Y2_9AGAR|nr:Nudix hydrolase domain-containing protein [Mycena indigotica]KAF7295549.1 Nudix hydrolase domain-containing protein [Mycena indigotica]